MSPPFPPPGGNDKKPLGAVINRTANFGVAVNCQGLYKAPLRSGPCPVAAFPSFGAVGFRLPPRGASCGAGVWFFVVVFFFLLLVVFLPPSLVSALSGASSVGFCGSRSVLPPLPVWLSVAASVPAGTLVSCGCVGGVCGVARGSFPGASVFRAASFGSGPGSFVRRSVALVRSVAASPAAVWVSFPGRACPAGVWPSRSSSACFCGGGSGSWASAAFAVASGLPVFVWLPVGLRPPSGWGFVSLGGGWFFSCVGSQASLVF